MRGLKILIGKVSKTSTALGSAQEARIKALDFVVV